MDFGDYQLSLCKTVYCAFWVSFLGVSWGWVVSYWGRCAYLGRGRQSRLGVGFCHGSVTLSRVHSADFLGLCFYGYARVICHPKFQPFLFYKPGYVRQGHTAW